MASAGRINLPDGEGAIDVTYQAKGEAPPVVQPGNAPAVGRVQPDTPNPEPVAGAELQTAVPGEALPPIDNPGGTPLAPMQPGDPLPDATATVIGQDGVEREVPVEVGQTLSGLPIPGGAAGGEIGFAHQGAPQQHNPYAPDCPCGQEHAREFVGARIAAEGIYIGDELLPNAQLVAPMRVEHYACDESLQRITVSYVVAGVTKDSEVAGLVEDVPHHEINGCVCQLQGSSATAVDMFYRTKNHLRRFVLQRDRDDTGVSGTGVVAEGVLLTDGRVVLRWLGEHSSIVQWDDLSHVQAVHGHNGATRLRWLDVTPADAAPHPDSLGPALGATPQA